MNDRLHDALERTHALLLNGDVSAGMTLLVFELNEVRQSVSKGAWASLCVDYALKHELRDLLHRDPFTLRSYTRPRGYSGDAHLLDYIYSQEIPIGTCALGAQIFAYSTKGQASQSVRDRVGLLAKFIDDAAVHHPAPRILSVACGHLREAGLSTAVRERKIGEYIALDQDADSLAVIHDRHSSQGLRTIHSSIRAILSGKISFRGLHLVYAAGLYDYLSGRTASLLTERLHSMLAPGGKLLIANFTPDLNDIGYMEAYMNWHLIYRSPSQLESIAGSIDRTAIENQRVWVDAQNAVAYLEIVHQ